MCKHAHPTRLLGTLEYFPATSPVDGTADPSFFVSLTLTIISTSFSMYMDIDFIGGSMNSIGPCDVIDVFGLKIL